MQSKVDSPMHHSFVARSAQLSGKPRLLPDGARRPAPSRPLPPQLPNASAGVPDAAPALELSHQEGHPGAHLRRLRRHQLGKTLRNPGLQRMFGVFQAIRAQKTHLQVRDAVWQQGLARYTT